MRHAAILIVCLIPAVAEAQVRSGPVFGPWVGPAFGYYPGRYGGFWTNGNSLYGPPVPTYGSVPGFYGGADQTLEIFPDLRYRRFGPWGAWGPGVGVGVSVPLNPPPPLPVVIAPAVCELRLPDANAQVFLNGRAIAGTGTIRRYQFELPTHVGVPGELEARWSTPTSIGSARRSAVFRAGERTVVDFNSAGP